MKLAFDKAQGCLVKKLRMGEMGDGEKDAAEGE